MTTAVALLNAVIQGEPCDAPISTASCRLALLAIETQELAIAALRQVLNHPKDAEAFAHAARVARLIDDYTAKHAQAHPLSPPPATVDVSDLV